VFQKDFPPSSEETVNSGDPPEGIFFGTVMAAPPNFYTTEAAKLMDEVAMKM